jgi:hypothetical protein
MVFDGAALRVLVFQAGSARIFSNKVWLKNFRQGLIEKF